VPELWTLDGFTRMGKLLNKLTGRGTQAPEWVGEVHDAECRFEDIAFDAAAGTLSIRCWRPAERPLRRDSVWEELLIVFEGLSCPPTISQEETLPHYELSTIYFDPSAKHVHICFHAGLSIEYAAATPSFSFRGVTGQRRSRKEIFVGEGCRLTNRCRQRGMAGPVPLRGSRHLVPRA
jgi:hypothetical protein